MKILIVDDEQLARERLSDLLGELGSYELSEAANGLDALEQYNQNPADLILLDIRMPGMDGLETARHLCNLEQPPTVVFTTAYQDHALEAFEAQAIDYLLKPIRLERLQQAINKASAIQQGRLSEVQANETENTQRTHLSAKSKLGLKVIEIKSICYFKAEQKYVSAIWQEGELLLDEPLKELEAEFDDLFIRIHRNTLVAKQSILGLEKDQDGGSLLLLKERAEKLPVSRRHVSEVKRFLKTVS